MREEHDELVSEFVNTQAPSRLSQAALETLAVIAYKQPVTRGQVASIRAVNVDSVVRTLLARGLITELFTDAETGAIHYGTTDALLVNLGINSLDELPHISPLLDDGADGFDEVLRDERRRPGTRRPRPSRPTASGCRRCSRTPASPRAGWPRTSSSRGACASTARS